MCIFSVQIFEISKTFGEYHRKTEFMRKLKNDIAEDASWLNWFSA